MMSLKELRQLINEVQKRQTESDHVEVEEIPAAQKPCFYKQAGLPKGAYLQVGNQQLISSHCSITRRWIWMICPHHGNPNRKSSFIRQKTAAAVSRFALKTKPSGCPKRG
ncbi:MAG: hypothetical protein KAU38_13315 [Desulfobacterales bacterium]|nr:hypothetical protein [Desulfobacterales bacterium]